MESPKDLARAYLEDRAGDIVDWLDLIDNESPADLFEGVKWMVDLAKDDDLYRIAAGPLEVLITKRGPLIISALEAHAKNSRRFRLALGGVWGDERTDPDVWRRVQALVIPEGDLGLHDFVLPAPEGWQLDDSYGKGSAKYRPVGSADRSEVLVELHAHAKADATEKSFEAEKLACTKNVMSRGGFTQFVAEAPCATSLGRPAPVQTYSGRSDGWLVAIAYVDAPKAVYCIQLQARPETAFLAARPDLSKFVKGFRLLN